jgi:putative ATP-dependent endonuclease of the OLD family
MQVTRLEIKNFRGIQTADLFLTKHSVVLGDNNTGKTTVLESLDLVLGPDRLSRSTVIDEHDFYLGKYLTEKPAENEALVTNDPSGTEVAAETVTEAAPELLQPKIIITSTVIELSDEQVARFGDYIEFWDASAKCIYSDSVPEGTDGDSIYSAIRVTFIGEYNEEEDDFIGSTFFSRTMTDGQTPVPFSKRDKQFCGFLYLRSVRTGTRALSLEKGSLLDIILRLKEVRPQMWEETISKLNSIEVASNPELGISEILESINKALKKYVPKEWGVQPHLKVSNLTREHLRKVITAFIATGESNHAAPYFRQGTGTINMLVLAMLSQIAEGRQNVIFAMEEPETAIPPYAQKRIIHEVKSLSAQSIFTSHSPYVLEEFLLEDTMILSRTPDGEIKQHAVALPDNLKLKRYRQDFRTRFCEGLLSRRVLVAEGATEADSVPVVFRRLAELNPTEYSSLEALGICTVSADGEGNIPGIASLYKSLGKQIFGFCDKQSTENLAKITAIVEFTYMHEHKGFEDFVISNTTEVALKRYIDTLEWPSKLATDFPNPKNNPIEALRAFFKDTKGSWGIADFLAQCKEEEIPEWLRRVCKHTKEICEPSPIPVPAVTDEE